MYSYILPVNLCFYQYLASFKDVIPSPQKRKRFVLSERKCLKPRMTVCLARPVPLAHVSSGPLRGSCSGEGRMRKTNSLEYMVFPPRK